MKIKCPPRTSNCPTSTRNCPLLTRTLNSSIFHGFCGKNVQIDVKISLKSDKKNSKDAPTVRHLLAPVQDLLGS